ncbi:MAG: hypothetical protein JWP48_133 [Actinoallomurus sp.]|nr:hypothetical protein [Actinoallomurus sp.]
MVLTPSGGTVSGAELTVDGNRGADASCDVNKTRVFTMTKVSSTRHVAITVAIPSSVKSGTVNVTARVHSDDLVTDATGTQALAVKKPTSSSSGSSGSSSGSSGSSGSSSGSSGTSLPTGNLNPSGTGASATPSTGTDSAVLPSIAAQTPTTAPGPVVQNTGASQSMRGTADAADQLTFDKLASTQAAWLAALLVAFSLLLTQVRLGRANVKDPRQKGTHRRLRRTGSAH